MRVLLILPRPLFPPDTGGKIRSLNIFRRLAPRMEIHAVSLADPAKDEDTVAKMRGVFDQYTPVYWQEVPKFTVGFYAEFLRSRLSRFPYFLAKYRQPNFRRTIEELVRKNSFDLVVADFLQSAVVLLDAAPWKNAGKPAPLRVVFEHNVEFVIRKRHWDVEANPLRRWILRAEWEKARAVEGKVARSFDHVLTVSEDDRRTIMREFGADKVSALPTGVDLDYFSPREEPQRPGNLVFVGSMDWHPNEDGMLWFLREVYPRIRQTNPTASLTIVGRNPTASLRRVAGADPSVEITGRVEDVRSFLARAEVVVVPLRIGGGTRIKIFEAMAMERPVVSTTLGAEGLPLEAGREILLEDSSEGFARAVRRLLEHRGERQTMAAAGRAKVAAENGWDRVANRMEESLVRMVSERIASRGAAPAADGPSDFPGPPERVRT